MLSIPFLQVTLFLSLIILFSSCAYITFERKKCWQRDGNLACSNFFFCLYMHWKRVLLIFQKLNERRMLDIIKQVNRVVLILRVRHRSLVVSYCCYMYVTHGEDFGEFCDVISLIRRDFISTMKYFLFCYACVTVCCVLKPVTLLTSLVAYLIPRWRVGLLARLIESFWGCDYWWAI